MPDPDPVFLTAVLYGPVPGVELIPYFLGLLAWVGVAVAAILLAPLRALIRRLRKIRSNPPAESLNPSLPASVPESPDDGNRDRT